MVEPIKINRLNLEELMGVINTYPWYGAARKELCIRMAARGACSGTQYADAALYIGSRKILSDIARKGVVNDYSDNTVGDMVRESSEKKIVVIGGDYFSQTQYNEVRKSDDGIFSSFASREADADLGTIELEEGDLGDFYTETLARIYVEQEYYDKAKEIYSKLSLRYPEKSVYFAALIEKLDNNK